MTHYVGYKEISKQSREYFDDQEGEKIKLEFKEIGSENEFEKIEVNNDYIVEMNHIYDKEDDRKIYKCEFYN